MREPQNDLCDWMRSAYGASKCEVLRTVVRTVGAMFRVQLDDTPVWLRVGGALNRSVEQTEQEGKLLSRLVGLGVAIQEPKPRADGHYCERLQLARTAGVAIAYGEVSGAERSKPDREGAHAWGRALRVLHDTDVAGASEMTVVEPLENIGDRLRLATARLAPAQAAQLERIVTQRQAASTALCQQVVNHGDVRCANVRFQERGAVLLDTESLGLGPRAYDLGCAWRRRVVENQMQGAPEDWDWFKQGYEAHGELEPEIWQQASDMACLRALWTMTLPVEIDQGWGREWQVDPDYWATHVAHVEWFATHAP